MRIYKIEEAAEITNVSENDIVDAVRMGELSSYVEMEPSFIIPYTAKSIRHRNLMRICADEIEAILLDFSPNRREILVEFAAAEKSDGGEELRDLIQRALLAWYGAVLDDPEDREAAGIIQGLAAVASFLGLREDGSLVETGVSKLRVAA